MTVCSPRGVPTPRRSSYGRARRRDTRRRRRRDRGATPEGSGRDRHQAGAARRLARTPAARRRARARLGDTARGLVRAASARLCRDHAGAPRCHRAPRRDEAVSAARRCSSSRRVPSRKPAPPAAAASVFLLVASSRAASVSPSSAIRVRACASGSAERGRPRRAARETRRMSVRGDASAASASSVARCEIVDAMRHAGPARSLWRGLSVVARRNCAPGLGGRLALVTFLAPLVRALDLPRGNSEELVVIDVLLERSASPHATGARPPRVQQLH